MRKFLQESLATLEKKFPNISKSDLKHIWRTDPSGNNHWSKKIAQFYSEGVVGLDPILITIERYHNLTQRAKGARVSVKDINSFSTYNSFDNYVNELEGQVKKKAERFKKKQNYETIYEDSTWYVLYPEDFDTLATLGKDSDWCVAKSKSTYDRYKKNGDFLIFIDKKLFKKYKENSTPKENRSPNYKWLAYGTLQLTINNNKEKLSLNKKELADLKNKHRENNKLEDIFSKLDLKKLLKLNTFKLDKSWYNSNGKLHREDGPAVEYSDGTKKWYIDGKLHREDGPAIEDANETKYWYQNGELHREDGPAVEWTDGTKYWYIDGKRHREDGPAVKWSNGQKEWYIDGKRHREDGPAIEYTDGTKSWWLNNKKYSKEDWKVELIKRGLKAPK